MAILQLLNEHHDRSGFDCGNDALNTFLQKQAGQHARRGISRTYVLVDSQTPTTLIGFHTLVYNLVKEIPAKSKLTSYPHPLAALTLARMGVDRRYQGNSYGADILIDAICRVATAHAAAAPLMGLFVDAKTDAVARFYCKYGFEAINGESDPLYLWLPIGTCIGIAAEVMG